MTRFGPIAIDFGTTKTALAYAEPGGGKPIVVRYPTAVQFADEAERSADTAMFGTEALESATAWHSFKLYMGEDVVPAEICRKAPWIYDFEPPAPHHLAALIFRDLRLQFLRNQGLSKQLELEVGPVTITVPAESTFRQRQATVFAARVAGFRDISVLEEPVAAYLMHYFEPSRLNTQEGLISLVIDFGGGTCDMALIHSQPGSVPIVLDTRTLRRGGRDIDDAIVGRWNAEGRFNVELPENEQFPEELSAVLERLAKETKEYANPGITLHERIPDLLLRPLVTQLEASLPKGKENEYYYVLNDGQSLKPPKLKPDDFEAIMPEFLDEINRELSILLAEIGQDSVQHIILAGGSSWIRQFIDFVKKKFSHLDTGDRRIVKHISIAEAENSVVYGALEYQRNESEGKQSIHPRLSMSTYLEVDYHHQRDISPLQRWLSSVEFIRHNDKSYVELARKGEPLRQKRPRLHPPEHVKYIPVRPRREEVHWRIFQVRRVSEDSEDYEAITNLTSPVDEVKVKLPRWQTRLPISLSYAFDIYGDFYRVARPYARLIARLVTQWEKAPQFDWQNRDLIKQARDEYFGNEGQRERAGNN